MIRLRRIHFCRQGRRRRPADARRTGPSGGWPTLAACLVFLWLGAPPVPARGEEKSVPWWEAETTLEKGGVLTLSKRAWWKRAQGLEVGEHFIVLSQHPGGGQMLVRRELLEQRGKQLRAIVWVIDDDGYFDRWEIYRTGVATPTRVCTVRAPRVRDLPDDWMRSKSSTLKRYCPTPCGQIRI